jgi:transposase
MRGRKPSFSIQLPAPHLQELEHWLRSTNLKHGLARRARLLLLLHHGRTLKDAARTAGLTVRNARKWAQRYLAEGLHGLTDKPGRGRKPVFSPEVALHLVKIACERPDKLGRSLSQWDCRELAAQLVREGVVESSSPDTVRRILENHHLKPWRHHLWLSPKVPRDADFAARVQTIADLYTRVLQPHEAVLCVDEKTSLQPRPRKSPTKAAAPGQPTLVEHEYGRCGALNLFAAFNTRTGQVYGMTAERKRQEEFIAFLEMLDREFGPEITVIHVVLDNLRMHKGKKVQAWLAKHPRFVFHHPPVHCSWMNQVEQWFSILQRKRLTIVDFASKAELAEKLQQFIAQWNEQAHPFNWTKKSVAKVMAKCQQAPVATTGTLPQAA